jgi:hypothetical protein
MGGYMYLIEIVCEGTGWINLYQDRGLWRAFVNTVMKLCGKFLD